MTAQKVILITGASSGFGYAVAEELLGRGAVVFTAARRMEKMEPLREKGAMPVAMDVTSDASVADGVSEILRKQGRLDVLVNNAGYGGYGMLESVPLDEARRQFEVNVFGAMRMIRAVLPQMRVQGGGRIVNMSSIVGVAAMPMVGWYSSSKHALEALTDALRTEVHRFGISLPLIEPGPVKTEFEQVALEQLATVNHDPVYRKSVDNFTGNFKKMYANAPEPEVVVRTVVKAVYARRPKTRYPIGVTGLVGTVKKLLSDRMMDAIWRRVYGIE
ncbi:MAG: SDR family NAD(P)-dependent oxidoreductase [Chitinispirillaceae bacterium]|nr:SDR family NAD(P)-dependent oxidoreductase [Chitinispirillaceae bacterium]